MTESSNSEYKDAIPHTDAGVKPTTHRANCHCGAVRFTVTLKYPFPEYKINKCNCSICIKNGYLLVYPPRKDLVWIKGRDIHLAPGLSVMFMLIGYDNMTEYYFGMKKKAHKFCKTCGTSILIDFKRNEYGVTDPEKDKLAVNVLPSLFSLCHLYTHVLCTTAFLLQILYLVRQRSLWCFLASLLIYNTNPESTSYFVLAPIISLNSFVYY